MTNYEEKLYNQFLDRINDDNYLIIQWHITNRCEENCKHCYLDKEKIKDFPYEYVDLVLNKIYDLSILIKKKVIIILIGGDPLLNPNFWEIVKKINKYNFFFKVSGNYHKLNLKNIKRLKNEGVLSYQMSLDGPEQINDNIRSSGNYIKTLNSIKDLIENDIEVTIKSVISSYNINHIKKMLYEISAIENFRNIKYNFCRFIPNKNNEKHYIENIKPNSYKDFIIEIFKLLNEQNKIEMLLREHLIIPVLFEKNIIGEDFIERINYIYKKYNRTNFIDSCSMWRDFFVIDINGNILPCKKVPIVFGNIIKDDFYSIKIKKDQFLNTEENECQICKYYLFCKGCPAVSYSLKKSIFKKDPTCWIEL
jgi:radical SAM protein with 4Fe4S-binding SPASM domain